MVGWHLSRNQQQMLPWQCKKVLPWLNFPGMLSTLCSFLPSRLLLLTFLCFRHLCPWLPIINTPSAPPSSLSTSTTAPAPASLRHCHEIPISSNLAATALDGAPERQLRQNTCDHQRSPHHELSHQVRIPQKSTRHWNRWKISFSLDWKFNKPNFDPNKSGALWYVKWKYYLIQIGVSDCV